MQSLALRGLLYICVALVSTAQRASLCTAISTRVGRTVALRKATAAKAKAARIRMLLEDYSYGRYVHGLQDAVREAGAIPLIVEMLAQAPTASPKPSRVLHRSLRCHCGQTSAVRSAVL